MEDERTAQPCLSYASPNRVRFKGSDLRPLRPPLGSYYASNFGLSLRLRQVRRLREKVRGSN